ncbi:H-type lectin domain-containing protein [Roseivivax isoporae]|uniref:ATP synthase n=1 Tax=Roseivivax isoporae LMG 25204 TaxID=1449351 RepID=X7F3X3_9RHOB|nr:H-type lectin domain-containing protein [Roseivivax isoporae]ETX27592.1 ATP synthase [Roseivivax isoporae LMG 25204]
MKRLNGATIGVDQGAVDLFSEFATGGDMWTGSGTRERRRRIAFSEPFRAPPTVQVALALWDMDSGPNIRADVAADDVNEDGFDMVFRTWSDSRVARVRMTWLAIGELRDEDSWELY